MTATAPTQQSQPVLDPERYRLTIEEYLAIDETGVLDNGRIELVNGDLWTVTPRGSWHGRTTFRLGALLTSERAVLTDESLAIGSDSLPHPDLWVCAADAEPIGRHGQRVLRFDPIDVLLVAEISDTTASADLTIKADLYARGGFGCYWVVTPDEIVVHTEPGPDGYATKTTYRPGTKVPYLDHELDVSEILGR